jgi:serine/threonine protein phosphatase PrpC
VPRPSFKISVHGATDRGKVRDENQDSFAIVSPEEAPGKGFLLVLADGMGGLAEGATASRIVVETLREAHRTATEAPGEALVAAIRKANRLIHESEARGLDRDPMGSTVAALVFSGQGAWVAHVGDSRVYRVPLAGALRRLTRDHTWVEELSRRGDLEPGSIQYALHRNVLTRGVGLRQEVQVDLLEIADLCPGDVFLLTSDGLHELVEEGEIESRVRARQGDLVGLAEDLIGLARERGGPDNITAVLARVEAAAPPPGPATASREVAPQPREEQGPGRVFPSPRLLPLSHIAAFALGVGTVFLLQRGGEGPPPPRDLETILRKEVLDHPESVEALRGSPQGRKVLQELEAALGPPDSKTDPKTGPEEK